MPRKQKQEKRTITVVVNGKPVTVILHPPTGTRKSWYAYWSGLVASKSTGTKKLEDAVVVAEDMVRNGGERTGFGDDVLTDEEFEQVQRVHFGRKADAKSQQRAMTSLAACLEAITAFKVISGLAQIVLATADDCASFQRKALALPKNWRHQYPKSKKDVERLSPSTVFKWSAALQAAFERVNRNAGKTCVRGVVDERKLLTENPWKQFTWIEPRERPIRQFDGDELLSFLKYLATKWSSVTVAPLVAKVCLWSWSRRDEVMALSWACERDVAGEHHFEIEGKWGVKKWFRVPDGLYHELLQIKSDSSFVFAAYCEQLRQHFEQSPHPGPGKNVSREFIPENLGDWFCRRIVRWSRSLPKGHATTHIFRKTTLQYARFGEDVNRQVAQDARLGEGVMMTHYVKESDVEMRQASNRTFQRILASLSSEVAREYGYRETNMRGLEKRLDAAKASKDWRTVAEIAAELAKQKPPKAPTDGASAE